MVKRYGYLWDDVTSMENLVEAYKQSRKGKKTKPQVIEFDKDPKSGLLEIQRMLKTKTYKSGGYRGFIVHERGKERVVYDIDYYPHRIVHWAVMLVIRPILMNSIGGNSYSAMKGRGSHQALHRLKHYLHTDPEYTQYCFKMDVKKYFPSIDKDILVQKLTHKIKDPDVMWLLKEIIYGYDGPGLPIGNYTSQYLANYYFADIDRYFKQEMHCRYYLRYMDDIIILGRTKGWLKRIKRKMEEKLKENGLTLKNNWQIFPVESRGVDFVGYRTFHDYSLLRKATKINLIKKCADARTRKDNLTNTDKGMMASYNGILMHCDSYRLRSNTLNTISEG